MVPSSDSFDFRAVGRAMPLWYTRHARSLPWRVSPAQRAAGIRPDPYHVWLSEVMLQQTQVTTAGRYFTKFLRLWPNVRALAQAQQDDVLAAWAGLGYYSRARNLKRCAEIVADLHHGAFPRLPEELRRLPGIGAYTANAIAAIAFDQPVAAVDGNVERVAARLLAIGKPVSKSKGVIAAAIAKMVPKDRPGDFAQALMDLGATVCTPKNPACRNCPLSAVCRARRAGETQLYPVREQKRAKRLRRGAAFVARSADGAILLRRRAEKGMLGGMAEVPTTKWSAKCDGATDISGAPFAAQWQAAGTVRHSFTHFDLELTVWRADLGRRQGNGQGRWVDFDALGEQALPTVMKKVIATACPDAFRREGAI